MLEDKYTQYGSVSHAIYQGFTISVSWRGSLGRDIAISCYLVMQLIHTVRKENWSDDIDQFPHNMLPRSHIIRDVRKMCIHSRWAEIIQRSWSIQPVCFCMGELGKVQVKYLESSNGAIMSAKVSQKTTSFLLKLSSLNFNRAGSNWWKRTDPHLWSRHWHDFMRQSKVIVPFKSIEEYYCSAVPSNAAISLMPVSS